MVNLNFEAKFVDSEPGLRNGVIAVDQLLGTKKIWCECSKKVVNNVGMHARERQQSITVHVVVPT